MIIDSISSSKKLESKYKDHRLKGELNVYRECHIIPDLLLVYKLEEKEGFLILVDIGSHSQLFG